eukprot:m.38559 g.38559  ORF g.38559 m.38559 type:complete len:87 (-) comp12597_c0_seq4:130-390(-)
MSMRTVLQNNWCHRSIAGQDEGGALGSQPGHLSLDRPGRAGVVLGTVSQFDTDRWLPLEMRMNVPTEMQAVSLELFDKFKQLTLRP